MDLPSHQHLKENRRKISGQQLNPLFSKLCVIAVFNVSPAKHLNCQTPHPQQLFIFAIIVNSGKDFDAEIE